MRTSEKILLSFITIGIVALGSFVGWKYYTRSANVNNVAVSSTQSVNSQTQSNMDPLAVRNAPYYGMSLNGKKESEWTKEKEAPVKQINSNNNSTDDFLDNDNLNTNSGNLVSASYKPNSNAAVGQVNSNINKNNNSNANPNIPNNNANPEDNSNTFLFAVVGDTQSFETDNPKGAFQKAIGGILNANVDLVMAVGDLVPSCDSKDCAEHLSNWKQVAAPILPKTKMTMGNHDRIGEESSDKAWQNAFDLPTNGPDGYSELAYSFDLNNAHFIVLNSEKPETNIINKAQRDWLESDLSSNTKENVFVFYHEPAYPVSSKINESLDVNKSDRNALWNILKNHNVTAVFSGHEHIMSRKKIDGIYQFVVGNTDAFDHDSPKPGVAEYAYRGHHYAIVGIKGREVMVNVYKVDGTLLDSFVIPR